MKTKKLNLSDLQVKSFAVETKAALKGGAKTLIWQESCGPVFCEVH